MKITQMRPACDVTEVSLHAAAVKLMNDGKVPRSIICSFENLPPTKRAVEGTGMKLEVIALPVAMLQGIDSWALCADDNTAIWSPGA